MDDRILHNWLPSGNLSSRIDAEYYSSIYIAAYEKIANHNGCILEQLTNFIRKGIFDMPASLYSDEGVPFVRISDFNGWFLNLEKCIKMPLWKHEKEVNTILKGGDLILSKVGTTGNTVKVPDETELNISQNVVGLSINHDAIDSCFLLAYLNCRYGNLLLAREVTTAVQGKLTLDVLRELYIPEPNSIIQFYIGNKVRQAEMLSSFAKNLEVELKNLETNIPVQKPSDKAKRHSRVSFENFSSNRLNAEYYKNIYLNIELQLQSEDFVSLDSCCSGFKYGASVAADYVETNGITFIRGNNLAPNRLDETDVVSINSSLINDLEGCFVNENDILITRSGTVGVCCVVPESFNGAAYGSFIIKFQSNEGWEPDYIAWFINSWIGQSQVRRLENGAVQLNINTQELSSIKIWQSSFEFQRKIKLLVEKKNMLLILSNKQCDSSKKLVESLIESKITETELIQAQQTLEKRDNTLDRQILGRLKSDGIDGDGDPLFNDLDQLYEALEQATDQKNEA